MLVAFWVIGGGALLLALLQLGVALRLGSHMRPVRQVPDDPAGERPPLSVLVPLRGAPAGLSERLVRLLDAMRPSDQLVVALETEDDPGYSVVTEVQAARQDRDVQVVLSGPAGERMGKQHNLNAALERAKHDLLAFMDDDVLLERANLEEAAATVAADDGAVGAAFALPYYGGGSGQSPRLGAHLVADYTNHGFAPNMASLALQGPPRFIIGGFWATSRAALDAIGGLEHFTATVSDDAAIGRAFAEAGRTNVMLRHPVRLEPEDLGFQGGVAHVLKWLTLLRAEGLGVLLLCFLTWNPLASGLVALVLALLAPAVTVKAGLLVIGALLVLRALSVFALDVRVYGLQPPGRYLPMQLLYETVLAPWLFLTAIFRREVVWRGRRYRLEPGGYIG